tara:strand:- start:29 stop:544 length:516 start_codon:yes stop_codon:yes gene_type:complete
MNHILPLSEVPNIAQSSSDLAELVSQPINDDLVDDFPKLVSTYRLGSEAAHGHLLHNLPLQNRRSTDVFVVFSGNMAVGLSVISFDVTPPIEIGDLEQPNLSGFICNPFRGKGLGALSLDHRLAIIGEKHGNKAWTLVRHGNHRSMDMLVKRGFKEKKDYSSDTNRLLTLA